MSDATVGIIGAIVGFLAAFFAEPVKIYFQNGAKLKNLRLALYKEMIYNFERLDIHYDSYPPESVHMVLANLQGFKERVLRRECYQQAITGQLDLFYQLVEAREFNHLYSRLAEISEVPSLEAFYTGDQDEIQFTHLYLRKISLFIFVVCSAFHRGELDKKILKIAANKKTYEEVVSRGTSDLFTFMELDKKLAPGRTP